MSLKLKILLVTEFYPPVIKGGGEINIALIAQSLAQKGMEISVLTSSSPDLPEMQLENNVTVYRTLMTGNDISSVFSNFKRSIFLPSSLKKEIKKLYKIEQFDVIHLIGATLIVAPHITVLGSKIFATIESYPALCPKGDRFFQGQKACDHVCNYSLYLNCQSKCQEIGKMKNKFFMKYNLPLLTYIYSFHKKLRNSLKHSNLIAISDYVKGILKMHGHESIVIPNIIDVEKFRKASENQIHFTSKSQKSKELKENYKEKLKISYFGTLAEYKGPMVVLKAIAALNNPKDLTCDLYGNGPLKSELVEFITQKNLDATVHEHIPYEKVPEKYAESDIIVFPSIWPEPFGRIAIEGIAAGKIVIGSNVGGISETLKDSGIFFEPGNVEQLKDILQKIVNKGLKAKSELKSKSVKESKSIIDIGALEKMYSSDSIADMIISYYISKN